MLTLAAADTLAGVAQTASKVTCTIFGMELNAGTEVYKILYQGQLANAAATIYTVPTSTQAFIRSISVVNTDTVVQTFQLFRGGLVAANAITQSISLPAGGMATYEDGDGWMVLDSAGAVRNVSITPTGYVRPVINVMDYGATGNGSTDDRAAIQAAIAAAGTSGVSGRGVDLYFPAGVYAIGATLTCPYNIIQFRGSGWQSTVLYATFTTGDILQLGDGTARSGCGLTDMSVWCNAARTSGASINVNGMSDCVIKNFVINNCFQGVLVQNTSLKVWVRQGEINNIHVTDGVGVQVTNGLGGDTYISDIVMSNNPANKPLAGIQITQTGHTRLWGCNITSCGIGLSVNPGASQDCTYLFIDDCLFDSGGTHGAKFAPTNASGRIRSVMAVNSWFSGCLAAGYGIEFGGVASSTVDGFSFIGCRVLNNYNHGIGITYASANNISLTDCSVSGNGTQTINTYDAINIVANVNGFSALNCELGQSGAAGNQQRYALNIAAGTSSSIQIIGNSCSPNGSVGTGGYMNVGALTGNGNQILLNTPQSTGGPPQTLATAVATSGVGETLLHRFKVPANSVKIGDTFEIELHGISSSTGTLIFTAKVGANGSTADTVCWTSITAAAQVANQRGGFSGLLTVRSLTTVQCTALGYAQAALLPTVVAVVATPTITSTADWYIDLCCACSVGTFTAQVATVTPL